ncbi:porin [Anopheles sinensis]|uniref:Porin n=1 Tax=Anopheles sinensis TaxID=74873 RepID=A0A084VG76_ANOSI|nr:porin [Anopheles sinensis]
MRIFSSLGKTSAKRCGCPGKNELLLNRLLDQRYGALEQIPMCYALFGMDLQLRLAGSTRKTTIDEPDDAARCSGNEV